ncbi:MAG: hypothetical protein AB2766_11390 [Candidatus Thiodiazotropha endolucinida]
MPKKEIKITALPSKNLDTRLAPDVISILLSGVENKNAESSNVSAVQQGPVGRIDRRAKARVIKIGARQKSDDCA